MSFKKEVRIFIQEFWAFRRNLESENKLLLGYQKLVDRLEKQNERLMDKIMARSLPELKTFQLEDDLNPLKPEPYNMLEDEDVAGEILPVEEEGG